jgi:flagellar hook-associated protein 2
VATISSPGIGSGLDINGIITKLMQVESQPLSKINSKEASFQARISALGSLQSAIGSLNSAFGQLALGSNQTAQAKFVSYKATVADPVATATASSTAVAGSYTLEVTQLAKAHRITTTTGLANADSAIAQGTLSIQIGSGPAKTLTIDGNNDTLGGLRDAINAGGFGVTASLTEIASGDVRLTLTSNTVGTSGEIKLSGLAGYSFDASAASGNDFSQASADGGQPAQGAIVKINGLTINTANNTLTGAIQGVSLTLLKETTSPTTVSVSRDTTSTLRAALEGIVKSYNELNKTIKDLGSYNSETKQGGVLLGDATLRTIASALRNAFQTSFRSMGTVRHLSDLGVSFQRDGSLSFDTSKLAGASSADLDAALGVAVDFGKAAKALTAGMLGDKGTLTAATNGAQASIKALDVQRERLADRLTQIEARYRKQFTALDSLVASMNQTSSYLQRQLSSLPGASSSN